MLLLVEEISSSMHAKWDTFCSVCYESSILKDRIVSARIKKCFNRKVELVLKYFFNSFIPIHSLFRREISENFSLEVISLNFILSRYLEFYMKISINRS